MKVELDLMILVGSWAVCIIWGWGAGMYMATFFVSVERFGALVKRVDKLESKNK